MNNYLLSKQTLNHLVKLGECLFTNLKVVGSSPLAVTYFITLSNISLYFHVLLFLCTFVFVFLKTSLDINFGIAKDSNCVKSVQIRSYRWSVFSCIRNEYRKIRTRNNSVFGHFSRRVRYSRQAIGIKNA